MLNRHAIRILATGVIATAAGVALWAIKRQPTSGQAEAIEQERSEVVEAAPRAVVVVVAPGAEKSFDDGPALTAMPRVTSYRMTGADDYESLSPDQLSAAFLTRATESWSEVEPGERADDDDLDGFQLATIETLTVPELNDDPADFEIPSDRRERI